MAVFYDLPLTFFETHYLFDKEIMLQLEPLVWLRKQCVYIYIYIYNIFTHLGFLYRQQTTLHHKVFQYICSIAHAIFFSMENLNPVDVRCTTHPSLVCVIAIIVLNAPTKRPASCTDSSLETDLTSPCQCYLRDGSVNILLFLYHLRQPFGV